MKKTLFIVSLLILLALPIIFPYFHKGYFPTHDGEWAVVRLGDMFRSLRDHQFPVRYSGYLNFGYGYPLFNFTYPAPYYIGILFHFFKFGFVDTIKLLFVLSVIVSGVGMYFAANEIWKNKIGGLISAIFYLYFPYRIVDLYARGSIGESLSFAIFPLVFYAAARILDSVNPVRYIILGAVSYSFLIMTHNIMALLFSPVLLLFIISKLYFEKIQKIRRIVYFVALSFGLSAFFWIPALAEKNNILLSKIPIADRSIYFVKLSQLIIPKWGYGLPDHPDGFSYQIGLPQILLILIVLCFLLFMWLTQKKSFKKFSLQLAAILIGVTIVCVLLMFSFSSVIWQITPLFKEINYPWTLLGIIGFLISLLCGFLWTQGQYFRYVLCVLCVCNIVLIFPNAKPQYFVDRGDGYYLTNDATTTSSHELMPLWVKKIPAQRTDNKVQIIQGAGEIDNVFSNSKKITFGLILQEKSYVKINTIYYPGWRIAIDGKDAPISYNNDLGVMNIIVGSGKYTIQADFTETPLRILSDCISVVSLVLLITVAFTKKVNSKFIV